MKRHLILLALAVMMILSVALMPVAYAADTDNLNDCMTDFIIKDASGDPVTDGSVVNTSDTYTFMFKFAEVSDGNQFGNSVTYTLPDGIALAESGTRSIYLEDGTTKVADCVLDQTNGKLIITFLNDWQKNSLTSTVWAEFRGKFTGNEDKDQKKYDLGNNKKFTADLRVGASLDAKKSHASYDTKTRKMTYTVTVKANGPVSGIELSDVPADGMSYVSGSAKVNGTSVTPTSSGNPLIIPVGDLETGETATVTYEMIVDQDALDDKAYQQTDFDNTASAKGKNGTKDIVSDDTTTTFRVTQKNLTKDNNEETIGGTPVIHWSIKIGDAGLGVDISGKPISDTLGPNQTMDIKPDSWADYIRVRYGNPTVTEYVSSISAINLPAGTTEANIDYYVTYTGKKPVGNTEYTNDVSIIVNGNTWSTGSTATLKGTVEPGIEKSVTGATEGASGTITYQVKLTVPAGTDQTGEFYLLDSLKTDTGSGSTIETANTPTITSITVNGTAYTDYTVKQKDNYSWYLLFGGTTLTQPDQSKWEETGDATVVITYTIPRNGLLKGTTDTTIDSALQNGATLWNAADLYFAPETPSKEAKKDYTENSNKFMDKVSVAIDTKSHTIDYEVTFALDMVGKWHDGCYFRFIDEFDQSLEYVSGSFAMSRDTGTAVEIYKVEDNTSDSGWCKGNILTVPSEGLCLNGDKNTKLFENLNKNDVLTARYTLKIKDPVYQTIDWNTTEASIDFDNTAKVVMKDTPDTVIVTDSYTAHYPTGLLTKDAQLVSDPGTELTYTIEVNPYEKDLAAGNELTLTDTIKSMYLSLEPETLSVKNAKTGTDLGNCWQIRNGGKEIIFKIPDETHIIITYVAKVTKYGENVEVENGVELAGVPDSTIVDKERFRIAESNYGASGDHGKFTLFKYDEESGEPLGGATFELYTTKTNSVNLGKTLTYDSRTYYLADSFTTISEGYTTVEHVVLTTDKSDTYVLVETDAPDGYEKLKDPIVFTFHPQDTVPGISIMDKGAYSVANKKTESTSVQLIVKKTVEGDTDTTVSFEASLTPVNGAPMPEAGGEVVSVQEDKTNAFGKITYTADNLGTETSMTFTYVIMEIIPDDDDKIPGMTYDGTEHTVKVTLEYAGGELTVHSDTGTATDPVTITNTYEEPKTNIQLVVKKTVDGDTKVTTGFEFTLTGKDGAPMPATGGEIAVVKQDETGTFGGITYTYADLGGEQSRTFTYVIVETEPTDKIPGMTYDGTEHTVKVTLEYAGGELTVHSDTGTATDPVTITNIYEEPKTNIQLVVKKVLEGKTDTATEFTVTLSGDGKAPVPAAGGNIAVIRDDMTGTFGEITYTHADLGGEQSVIFTYVVTETKGNAPGVDYDGNEHTVKVTLAYVNGVLTVSTDTGTLSDPVVITNTYGAEGSIVFEGTKVLNGRELTTDDVFTFTVKEGDETVATGRNDVNGKIIFTGINYIHNAAKSDIGDHIYTVTEDDTALKGITKDDSKLTVTVRVTDNGDGTLKTEIVSGSDDIEFVNEYSARGSADLQAVKYMTIAGNIPGVNDTFDFILEKEDGTSYTVQNGPDGVVDFGTFEYTQDDPGTYVYKIREKQLLNGDYVTDPTTYEVTVEVKDNGDGTMKVTKAVKRTDADGTVTELKDDEKIIFVNDYRISISITKEWQGGEEDEIELILYADGQKVAETETATDPETGKPTEKRNYVLNREGYRYTFSQLIPRNDDGSLITYGVKEKGISGYMRIYQNVGEYRNKNDYIYDGGTVINRAVTSIKVKKIWEGIDDEGKRPEITLTLYCNGTVYNKKPSGPNKDGWYTWNNLPTVYAGRDAVYYVMEEPLEGFTITYTNTGMQSDITDRAYNGGTITNSGVPKTGDPGLPILWTILTIFGIGGTALLARKKKQTHA